jgi:hypothetical protein
VKLRSAKLLPHVREVVDERDAVLAAMAARLAKV